MNNSRLQHFLAALGSVPASASTPLEREAAEVMTWALGKEGPVALADAAAWELLSSECYTEQLDGHTWWRAQSTQLTLPTDDFERERDESVAAALRYLAARHVLVSHPSSVYLVRWPE